MIVYLSIGNSDDKLTQVEWAEYWHRTDAVVTTYAAQVYGEWMSLPVVPYQNACWCIEIKVGKEPYQLMAALRGVAYEFGQDSISWAEVGEQRFLKARQVGGS